MSSLDVFKTGFSLNIFFGNKVKLANLRTKMWLGKRDKYMWPCYVVSRVDETKLEVRMLAVGKNGNLKTVEQTNVQPYLYDESLKKKVAESNHGELKVAFSMAEKIVAGQVRQS